MVGDGRGVSALLSARQALPEPPHLYPLCGGPEAHIETAEICYVPVGDPAALALDGHEPLFGPQAIPFSYPVQLLDRLALQRRPKGPAELPLAALPELLALQLHEPFPTHTLQNRLFTRARGS